MRIKTLALTALLPLLSFLSIAQSITNEDIWQNGRYRSDYVYGLRSMNDGEHYTTMNRVKGGVAIYKSAYATGEVVADIFNSTDAQPTFHISDYAFNSDETQLLLMSDLESIYRYSTKEVVYVYSFESKSLTQIADGDKIMYPTFSPNGKYLAYVKDNNLYYSNLATGEEFQITGDGQKNVIINGATDWVYEEEFALVQGFEWSPNSNHIAYLKFQESEVKEFSFPFYQEQLYPETYKYKYPKAGEANSIVTLNVFSLESNDDKTIAEVNDSEDTFEYIPRFKWVDNEQILFQELNRHQSHLKMTLSNVLSDETKTVYEEESETYIEVVDGWEQLGNKLYITSEKSGFNHIYAIDIQKGTSQQITKGNWDVTSFYGTDGKSYAYFQSAEESPMKRSIYRIKLNGGGKQKLTTNNGWNDAEFSTGMKYFINNFSSANDPGNITLMDAKGKVIRELKNNEQLKGTLSDLKSKSTKEFFSIPLDGYDLNAWMMKPANFDATKKYPVLIAIYGGPGSQQVVDRWGGANYMWHQLLTEKGYIVVSVDNRGTGARGADFKKMTYQNLGNLELEDFKKTSAYLKEQNYVDANRIGIWGWSYGGYMSSLAITKGNEFFNAAIAVAPVTTWRFYDNIYTERYMRTPQENASGYDDNSPLNFADKLEGNYLLIHGNADDNVHFQNSAEMVNALIKANKDFDFFMYPDRNHGIYGGNTRLHIYNKMTNWLLENL